MADEKEQSFKVSDRRLFNPDGTLREPATEDHGLSDEVQAKGQSEGQSQASQSEAARVISFPGEKAKDRGAPAKGASGQSTGAAGKQSRDHRAAELPEASLEGLINMLAVEAVMHLGLIENPMGGRVVDLEAARHVIDMLGVVQNKTQGNLTKDEAELLANVLADLRMQFVGISRGR
jgi:hypothetical protein